MRKHILMLGAISVVTAPSIALSDEKKDIFYNFPGEFSGTVSIVSDYAFRGITQTDENPAIQGSIDYSVDLGHDFGLYLGTWASNVDFNDSSEASTEFDYYGGLTYSYKDFSIDVGAIYYDYPGAADSLNYDYIEYQAGIGYDFKIVSASASINYSPENFGDSGDAQYYKFALEAPLFWDLTADAHIGRQRVDDNVTFGNPDYTDWSVGLGYGFKGLDLKVQYVDTNLDSTDCADGCDAKAIVSVSKTL